MLRKFAFVFLLFGVVHSEEAPFLKKNVPGPWTQKGELLSLKLVPKGKIIEIYVVGLKQKEIKINETNLDVTLTGANGQESTSVTKKSDYFLIERTGEESELHIRAKVDDKTESFKFNLLPIPSTE